ncbi:MAG: Type 1 glutamine amidotransferase-like domain-containing protein [Nakamurella sp.]
MWRFAYAGVHRVLYWPFALNGDILDTAGDWICDALRSLGLTAQVTTWTSLEGRDADELEAFDLLHVGGGNTFRLLDHIQRHAFVAPVRAFVELGGRYYGGSAGAIIACEDIGIAAPYDPNNVGLTNLNGLALVPAYSVLPHFDDMVEPALCWVREHQRPLLAVPERGGIRYGDETFTAIGPDSSTEITELGPIPRPAGMSWIDRGRMH